MKSFFLLLALLSFSALSVSAQSAKKPKLNSNVFEQESKESSITGKVKAVRVVQEETEVFIDNPKGNSGPYLLPQNFSNRAAALKTLQKSQKVGGPAVTIGIDDQQRIKSVEESESSTKTTNEDWAL